MADNDEELDEDEKEPLPVIVGEGRIPEHWLEPEDVEQLDVPYSTRAAGDWIISGPIGDFPDQRGGRRFDSWEDAELWAKDKYSSKFKGRVADLVNSATNRWGFFIGQIV